jgi:hypothetical protein
VLEARPQYLLHMQQDADHVSTPSAVMHSGPWWTETAMSARECPKMDMGVFVTREHVRHNKSGIAHRGRTGINHLRELPTKLNHLVGRLPCPTEPENHRCTSTLR